MSAGAASGDPDEQQLNTRRRVVFVVNLTAASALVGLVVTGVLMGPTARLGIAAVGVTLTYVVIRGLLRLEYARAAAWITSLSYAALVFFV